MISDAPPSEPQFAVDGDEFECHVATYKVNGACTTRSEQPLQRAERAGTIHGMDWTDIVPPFLFAVMLISASPGPAMALIFRRAALRGFGPTIPTVFGLELGIYLWALAAGAGIAALVAASHTAYIVLRAVGAAFLFVLGARALWAAWRNQFPDDELLATEHLSTRSSLLSFGEGLIVQLANPKAAIFMFAFYPQFIPAGQPPLKTIALLALLQVTVESGLYLALAATVSRAGNWFRRPRVRRRLEALTGTVLMTLGVRVATSHQ